MKRENPNRINELRLARKLNQRELADAVKAHWVTISKLERGEMKLTHDWMERIAPVLGVRPADLIADSSLVRSIYIGGHIESDGRLRDIDFEQRDDQSVQFEIDLGVTPPDTSEWYFVGRNFFGPICDIGSIVRFTRIVDASIDNFIDRICLVRTLQAEQTLVGVVTRGKSVGLYDMRFSDGTRARGVKVGSFLVLSLVLPLPLFTPDQFPEWMPD